MQNSFVVQVETAVCYIAQHRPLHCCIVWERDNVLEKKKKAVIDAAIKSESEGWIGREQSKKT